MADEQPKQEKTAEAAPPGKLKVVTSDTMKRERILKIGGIVGASIVVLLVVMKLIAPGPPPKTVTADALDDRKAKSVIDAFSMNQNMPQETWIAKGERRLDKVETLEGDINTRLQKMEMEFQRERESKAQAAFTNPNNAVSPAIAPPANPDKRSAFLNSMLPTGPTPTLPPNSAFPAYEKGSPTVIPGGAGPAGEASLLSNVNNDGLGIRVIANEGSTLPGLLGEKSAKILDKDTKENGDKNISEWMPTGSFMSGLLLSGLDAPTGGQSQSNPHPVLIRITDYATLPNRFRENSQECFVLGAGYGDIASERAYIRTEALSCVMKNGRTIDLPVKGYVAGEDGKTGMRGRLVSKEGQIIAKALLAGFASGIGSAFQQSTMTQSVSPLGVTQSVNPSDAFKAGMYGGVASSMNMLAAHYIKMAEQTFPIIEVDAGRKINVVMTKGFSVVFDEAGADEKEK